MSELQRRFHSEVGGRARRRSCRLPSVARDRDGVNAKCACLRPKGSPTEGHWFVSEKLPKTSRNPRERHATRPEDLTTAVATVTCARSKASVSSPTGSCLGWQSDGQGFGPLRATSCGWPGAGAWRAVTCGESACAACAAAPRAGVRMRSRARWVDVAVATGRRPVKPACARALARRSARAAGGR